MQLAGAPNSYLSTENSSSLVKNTNDLEDTAKIYRNAVMVSSPGEKPQVRNFTL